MVVVPGLFFRDGGGKLQDLVLHRLEIIHPLQAVVVDVGQVEKGLAHRPPLAVGAVQPAQHVFHFGVLPADVDHKIHRLPGDAGGKDQFLTVFDQSAVFGHKGELFGAVGEQVPQLVILVPACHHEAAPGRLHAGQDAPEARDIVGVIGAYERAVHIDGHQFQVRAHGGSSFADMGLQPFYCLYHTIRGGVYLPDYRPVLSRSRPFAGPGPKRLAPGPPLCYDKEERRPPLCPDPSCSSMWTACCAPL